MSNSTAAATKPATAPRRKRTPPSPAIAFDPAPRFIKLDTNGNHLPPTATGHVAVLDVRQQLIFLVTCPPKGMPHKKAEAHCAALEAMGHSDWRLPTVEELFPVGDRTRRMPAIDENFFPGTASDWYWTSTPAAWSPADCAWVVNFSLGSAYSGNPRGYDAFVRAVRSVGAPVGQ